MPQEQFISYDWIVYSYTVSLYVCVGVRISSLQSREEGGGSRGQGKQETLDGFVKQPSTVVRIYTTLPVPHTVDMR